MFLNISRKQTIFIKLSQEKILLQVKKYRSEFCAIYVSSIPDSINRAPQYDRDELYRYDIEQMNNWLKDVTSKAKEDNINFKIKVKQTNTSIVEEIIKSSSHNSSGIVLIVGRYLLLTVLAFTSFVWTQITVYQDREGAIILSNFGIGSKSADAENIDLIVIGSTGKSRLERIFVGSVAQGVISNAKCSVLLVR